MHRIRFHRQLSAWVAVFAILLLSLAPAISHALQGQALQGWTEVCTALGAKWVDASGAPVELHTTAPADPASAPGHAFAHCPYCALHITDLGLPPAPMVLALAPSRFALPRLFLAAPHTLHAWRTAQARAPPLAA